jgi:transposase InsO family protein
MQAKVTVPQLSRQGNWVSWEVKISAYLSLKSPPLDKYLLSPPNVVDADELEQDRQCRAILVLYVDGDLAASIKGTLTAYESYKVLKNVLLHALEVRGQILNQKITQLRQGARSTDEYVTAAQSLMIEAQDVGETTYMKNLCSQVILGLESKARISLADNLMQIVETNLTSRSSQDEISTVFNTIEKRIRARCNMLFASQTNDEDEQQAAMFAVQQGRHFPVQEAKLYQSIPHATPQPPNPHATPRPPNPHATPKPPHPHPTSWTPNEPEYPHKRQALDSTVRHCWYCDKPNHIKRNCRKFKADMLLQQGGAGPIQLRQPAAAMQVGPPDLNLHAQLNEMQQQLNRLTVTGFSANDADLPNGGNARMYNTRAIVAQVREVDCSLTELLLDGGSTHHVVRSSFLLFRQTASPINEVLVAGGESHVVTCCGSMLVQTPQGHLIFHNVLCVPSFIVNLLSVPQLDDQGYSVLHKNQSVTIKNEVDDVIMKGSHHKGLYKLDCYIKRSDQAPAQINVAAGSSLNLLHRRLGHPGMRATRELQNGNAVLGLMHDLHACKPNYCEVCINSKEHRAHFAPSPHKLTAPLQLIHSDLMGPFKCVSSGGHRYTCSLYDQFSGYGEMFLLKLKSDVNLVLRRAIYRWQRQTGCKVKVIRTDRGKEYQGKFQRFLTREGIVHQRSAAYTPEQNGVAERYNRTIIEKVRAMLNEFKLPNFLWGEAIQAATHIRNLMPQTASSTSPYELIFNVKPSADHLRVFGCTVHVHVPKQKHKHKTDPVGRTGMFVGYAQYSKAYRVLTWDTGKLQVIESANCVFAEHLSPTIPISAHRTTESDPTAESDDDEFWFEDLMVFPVLPEAENPEEYAVASDHEGSDTDDDAEATSDTELQGDQAEAPEADPANAVGEQQEHSCVAPPGQTQGKYPARTRNAPDRLMFKVRAIEGKSDFDHPNSVAEALARPDAPSWVAAINKELSSVFAKNVYEEVDLPPGKRALSLKLVLSIKRDQFGNIDCYKGRLVVRGFLQEKGIDFSEVFAPTAQSASFRVLTSIAAEMNFDMQQFDVSTAFLNGVLEEEVYVKLPTILSSSKKVWKLHKALYGLKQAARVWNETLSKELLKLQFKQSSADPCLFHKGAGEDAVYLLIHVDDGVIVGQCDSVAHTKSSIAAIFDIKDLGQATYFLSIEISHSQEGITLSQGQYVRRVLEQFEMSDCKGKDTPMTPGTSLVKAGDLLPEDNEYCSLVGSLLYLSVNTRPDISFAVSSLSRYMNAPTMQHMIAAKHVLRYLRKFPDLGLFYRRRTEGVSLQQILHVYADADFAGDKDGRKSTTGMIILRGSHPIAWLSKLQPIVTTSTTEAEFVAAATATKEGLWMRKLLTVFKGTATQFILKGDNEACIQLIRNKTAGVGGRTKHIDVQYMFVRERRERGDLRVEYVSTHLQMADMFTKALTGPHLGSMLIAIGMR